MEDIEYKVYKKVRKKCQILNLPLHFFYFFVFLALLIFSSFGFDITIEEIFIKIFFLAGSYFFLIFLSTKIRKFHILLGEKIPDEINLSISNPKSELKHYIEMFEGLLKKK